MPTPGQEYFDQALAAYRDGKFEDAITAFCLGLSLNTTAWEARLYLGMCYARTGAHREAKQEFLSIRDMCPDPELRKKAASALNMLGQMSAR